MILERISHRCGASLSQQGAVYRESSMNVCNYACLIIAVLLGVALDRTFACGAITFGCSCIKRLALKGTPGWRPAVKIFLQAAVSVLL